MKYAKIRLVVLIPLLLVLIPVASFTLGFLFGGDPWTVTIMAFIICAVLIPVFRKLKPQWFYSKPTKSVESVGSLQ